MPIQNLWCFVMFAFPIGVIGEVDQIDGSKVGGLGNSLLVLWDGLLSFHTLHEGCVMVPVHALIFF